LGKKMNTKYMILLAMALLGGCARKEPPPITIRILGPVTVETDGVRQTHPSLREDLRTRFNQCGMSPIILVADTNTTYATILPTRDVALSTGYWKFMLRLSGTTNTEAFTTHAGHGPPVVTVDIDPVTGQTRIDGALTEDALSDILGNPTDRQFHVWINAGAETTAAQLFGLLKTYNQIERTTPFIVTREDRIANPSLEFRE
jgi:hypothetical protein